VIDAVVQGLAAGISVDLLRGQGFHGHLGAVDAVFAVAAGDEVVAADEVEDHDQSLAESGPTKHHPEVDDLAAAAAPCVDLTRLEEAAGLPDQRPQHHHHHARTAFSPKFWISCRSESSNY